MLPCRRPVRIVRENQLARLPAGDPMPLLPGGSIAKDDPSPTREPGVHIAELAATRAKGPGLSEGCTPKVGTGLRRQLPA
jgi:hypothetical protein